MLNHFATCHRNRNKLRNTIICLTGVLHDHYCDGEMTVLSVRSLGDVSGETSYPLGGASSKHGGPGIFAGNEDGPLEIWVDTALPDRRLMIAFLEVSHGAPQPTLHDTSLDDCADTQSEGGRISSRHVSETTQLIILSPSSIQIFDMYCFPLWLPRLARQRLSAKRKRGEVAGDEWRSKVLLKAGWVGACAAVGVFLVSELPVMGRLLTSRERTTTGEAIELEGRSTSSAEIAAEAPDHQY